MVFKIRKNTPRKKTMEEIDRSFKPPIVWKGKKRSLLSQANIGELRKLIAEIDGNIEVWRDMKKLQALRRKKAKKKK